MDGLAALHELIEGAYFFREYLVWYNVVLAEEGIDVANGFHGDDFVGKLVIVLVDVPECGEEYLANLKSSTKGCLFLVLM